MNSTQVQLQAMTDEQLADAIPDTATLVFSAGQRKVCMTRLELREFVRALAATQPNAAPGDGQGAVAWYIDTHGVASVAIKREDLGLLANRYARPLGFLDATPSTATAARERENQS